MLRLKYISQPSSAFREVSCRADALSRPFYKHRRIALLKLTRHKTANKKKKHLANRLSVKVVKFRLFFFGGEGYEQQHWHHSDWAGQVAEERMLGKMIAIMPSHLLPPKCKTQQSWKSFLRGAIRNVSVFGSSVCSDGPRCATTLSLCILYI